METKKLCEKFIEGDKIINGENYGITMLEEITKDPKFSKYCPNNKCETNMQLDGLSDYLFNQLGTEIKEEYYEYFMMWLSDKLFKIANDKGESQINEITLNEAYEKYLKNNIVNYNYWSLLDIKMGLKEVNLMYMKQFYKLLNDICKAIVYYKSNKDDVEKFITNSTECYNQYSSLYNSVPKCNSYLHLLDNLKKTYEDFKNSVHDEIKKKYPDLAGHLQTLTIENTDSYFVGEFKEFDFSDEKCKPQKAKKPGSSKKMEQPPSLPLPQPLTSSQNTNELQKGKTGELSRQNGSEDSKSKQKDSENSKGNSNSENGSSEGGPGSGSSNSPGSLGGGSGSGAKEPWDQAPTHSSGASNGYWSINWGSRFNPLNYLPSASEIYKTQESILTSASDKISNAYNSVVTAVKDTYNSAVTNINYAYTTSTNYISGAVSSITNQLSSLGTFTSGDNQSGSGSSGNGSSTGDNALKTPQIQKPDPNSQSPPSQTLSDPQKSPDLPDHQNPSLSQPQDTPQTPSPSQPHSNQTQDKLQNTVKNDGSNTLQQPDSNTGTRGVQTMTNTKDTLPSSSTGLSNTGNGSTNGNVVKMNEKTSIWRIAQNKKYGVLGIGVISISIFAFLAIMYKYLSLGWTNKSKRKKNIKKVINSIGGKRPIQIIIKSYDRNKDLKPIINSVGKKKDPLLNIYKLMQADPVPFINLFFLLIFFVYKRKENFLEL
ncbi:hypothetical protein YYE_04572 [Plasmodium vinckei vinckei]|uniref:PIR protein CIR protein n=1 Tax=Plasmodium vinckei vinckei TaxID=54757 RepID=A0A081IAN3_PLAVN|nr:hypothetical protein YYE_04572 [Plasmodium vinckei vinckei]